MKIKEKLEPPYTEQERTDFINKYNSPDYVLQQIGEVIECWEYDEFDKAIIIVPEPPEPTPEEKLEQKKQDKIFENDTARDIALNRGVTYQSILFDSDTDQKANILGAVLQMSDTDTIPWFGMNNDCLICTKQDLLNIGGLITQLHSFCWNKNAAIKTAINEAQTIEEVESIKIDYKGEQ